MVFRNLCRLARLTMSRRMDSYLAHECRYKGLLAYGHAHRPLGRTLFFSSRIKKANSAPGASSTANTGCFAEAAAGHGQDGRSRAYPRPLGFRLSWAILIRVSGSAR